MGLDELIDVEYSKFKYCIEGLIEVQQTIGKSAIIMAMLCESDANYKDPDEQEWRKTSLTGKITKEMTDIARRLGEIVDEVGVYPVDLNRNFRVPPGVYKNER